MPEWNMYDTFSEGEHNHNITQHVPSEWQAGHEYYHIILSFMYEGYIASVRRMVMDVNRPFLQNCPVGTGVRAIGPSSSMRNKYRTRAIGQTITR